MLLDTYALKSGFESLLSINSSTKPAPTPPASYTKRVAQSMSRINSILKTLQVRPSPPEALVQAYLIHIADKSDTNFRKVLDLKGLKRADQSHLQELFSAHKASPQQQQSLQNSSPILTPLIVGGGGVGVGGGVGGMSGSGGSSSSIPLTGITSLSSAASLSTSHLPARFDPSNLGNAIMTAARDGVDRLGTPSAAAALSAANTPPNETSRTAVGSSSSPPPRDRRTHSPDAVGSGSGITPQQVVAGNLNENLRNIGKFFKRDMGSFGGRFGSVSGSGGGGSGGSRDDG